MKNETFGQRLARIRAERERSRQDVADATGVSYTSVGMWERDETVPTPEKLFKLADYLGIDDRSLWNGSTSKQQQARAAAINVDVLRQAVDIVRGIEKTRNRRGDGDFPSDQIAKLLAAAYEGLISPGAKPDEVERIIKLVA